MIETTRSRMSYQLTDIYCICRSYVVAY